MCTMATNLNKLLSEIYLEVNIEFQIIFTQGITKGL